MFSWKRTKGLLNYGWKLLASGLLDVGYNEARSVIIGKMYTPTDLAYYNKGKSLPSLVGDNLNAPINAVLFPVMSAEQDDKQRLKGMTRKSITTSVYILAPLLVGLAVVAPVLVPVLFTEKWNAMVPFLQILSLVYVFYPVHTANLQAIKAVGRSDLFLILEIIKKVVGIAILLSTMWFGVIWIALGAIFSSIISLVVNSYPNKKLFNYSIFEQIKDILPYLGLVVLMGAPVYAMNYLYLSLGWNMYLVLVMQIVVGGVIYVGLSVLFKLEIFKYLLNTIKEFLHKKNKKNSSKSDINVETSEIVENIEEGDQLTEDQCDGVENEKNKLEAEISDKINIEIELEENQKAKGINND